MSPYAAPLVTGISSYAETGISSGENEGGWRRGSSVELYLDFRGVEGGSPFPALERGLELKGPGTLLIERLDQTSERYLVDVGTEQLLHGKFYDFGKWGRHLAAGGLYQISFEGQDGQEVVFKIDAHAKPGNTPLVGRLLRLNSAK